MKQPASTESLFLTPTSECLAYTLKHEVCVPSFYCNGGYSIAGMSNMTLQQSSTGSLQIKRLPQTKVQSFPCHYKNAINLWGNHNKRQFVRLKTTSSQDDFTTFALALLDKGKLQFFYFKNHCSREKCVISKMNIFALWKGKKKHLQLKCMGLWPGNRETRCVLGLIRFKDLPCTIPEALLLWGTSPSIFRTLCNSFFSQHVNKMQKRDAKREKSSHQPTNQPTSSPSVPLRIRPAVSCLLASLKSNNMIKQSLKTDLQTEM